MVAADPAFSVEAAGSVSHAFTTHGFAQEADYFSAGEELRIISDTGAAITSYAFFGTGVYYQHAVLDIGALIDRLRGDKDDGASQQRNHEGVKKLALEAGKLFFDGLMTAQPRGKRNAFASDVLAPYALLTSGTGPTCNLGFAFLRPVTAEEGDDDLMCASINRLEKFYQSMVKAYGLKENKLIFTAYPIDGRDKPRQKMDETFELSDAHDFIAKAIASQADGEPAV
jgi:CRISPR system Cascade subunit CasC